MILPGDFSVHQEFTLGNYDQFRSKTRVDLPAFGPLSASVTYLHNERKGDTRNLGAGTVWDYSAAQNANYGTLTSPKTLGDQNVDAVSVAAKLDLGPDLKVVYKFNRAENDFTPLPTGIAGINTANGTGALAQSVLNAQPNPSILSPISRSRPGALNNAFAVPSHLRTTDHSITTTWNVSDTITVKDILAFRKRLIVSSDQIDGLGGLVSTTDLTTPYVIFVANSRYYDKQWSNELQVNITTQWFDLTAGYLHFDLDSEGGNKPGTLASFGFGTVPGHVIPAVDIQPTDVKTRSDAVYLQGEFHLTDQLDLTLGSRITSDRKNGTDRTFPGVTRTIRFRGDEPTYLVGVSYKPSSNILAYAKFSTGYISGGQLSSLEYDSSTAKSYEIGLKADWLDDSVRTNIALYQVDYNQIQFLAAGQAFGIAAGQVIFNGGDARVKGVEFEGTLVPIEGLTISGNATYTDFRYKTVNSILNAGVEGDYLPQFQPKWTGSGSIQYETEPLVDDAYLQFRFDANYTSRQYIGPRDIGVSDAYFNSSLIPAAWILNARIALTNLEFASTARGTIALWGRNLTDNKDRIGGANFRFLNTAVYQKARTYGVDFTIDF